MKTTRTSARDRGYGVTELPDGRYRARVELPASDDGKRRQRTRILATRDEAQDWARSILVASTEGTHIDAVRDSFDTIADDWLLGRESEGVRPVTIRGYRSALRPAREAFGHKPIQTVTSSDVRTLMRGLAKRAKATNRLTLYAIRGTFELAADDGLIRVNPAVRVKPTGHAATAREDLTAADAAKISEHVHGDRLELAWLLTLAGLRRSEIMGLRWSDVVDGVVSVSRGRVDMGSDSNATTLPKSDRGARELPLPEHLQAAVRRTKALRRREMLALGGEWDEGAYIAVDVVLEPLRPELYSDEWGRLSLKAKVAKPVTLHGARHGSATRMLDAGIPVHLVAAWHGHDPAVTLRTYAHADRAGLESAGAALAT